MIETYKRVVQDNIQQVALRELKQVGEVVAQQHSEVRELKRMLRNLEAPLHRLEQSSKSLDDVLKLVDRREQNDILDWISDISYGRYHSQVNRKALQGTGTWLHNNPSFLSWINSSSSQIMWLRGMPGSGKSVLLYVDNFPSAFALTALTDVDLCKFSISSNNTLTVVQRIRCISTVRGALRIRSAQILSRLCVA